MINVDVVDVHHKLYFSMGFVIIKIIKLVINGVFMVNTIKPLLVVAIKP